LYNPIEVIRQFQQFAAKKEVNSFYGIPMRTIKRFTRAVFQIHITLMRIRNPLFTLMRVRILCSSSKQCCGSGIVYPGSQILDLGSNKNKKEEGEKITPSIFLVNYTNFNEQWGGGVKAVSEPTNR